MKKKFTKFLSIFLAMLIVIGILPLSTMAKAYVEELAERQALEDLLNNPVSNEDGMVANIIGEVEEKRDEYTKVFKKDDGSYTAVMSVEPLHYLNDEGLWEEINNSMILQNGLYTNTDNNFNVELPKNIDSSESLTVENDGHSLSFSVDNIEESSAVVENNIVASDTNIPDADAAIAQTQSAVTYSEVAENTDLQYIVTPNSIKENIIVADKESVQSTYSFTFETNGLTAEKQDDGSVLFKDNTNDVKFRIPRPVMTDSSLAFSYDIAVVLTENANDTVTLTYTPSTEWINDANRSYPITIDPAIVLEDNDENWVEDTVVGYDSAREETQTSNGYNDFIGVVANQTITNNGEEGTYIGEIYTKINTNFLKQLGKNVIITEAQYLLSSASANGQAHIKNILEPVDFQTVTYNTKPSLSNEIIDYYTSPNADEAEEFVLAHFNITKPLNEWLYGEQNNGFAIVAGDSNFAGFFILNGNLTTTNPSTNTTTTQTYNTAMVLDFVDIAGYDNNLNYHSQEVGRAGTGYVNDFSQSLSVIRNDLSLDGNIMPVNLNMTYNSVFSRIIELLDYEECLVYGKNWLPNYLRGYLKTDDTHFTYYTETGSAIDFVGREGENGEVIIEEMYSDIYGDHGYDIQYVAKTDTQYETIIVTRPDGYVERFNQYGLLSSISNPDYPEQQINIVYTTGYPVIDYITDGVGRKYDFIYDETTGLLSKVKCYEFNGTAILAGSTTIPMEIGYSYMRGSLIGVTYPDGNSIKYTYNSNGNLTSMENVDGYRIAYSYNSNNRVYKVTEQALNSATQYVNGNFLTYETLSPTQIQLTDGNNNSVIYQFDKNGRILYCTDSAGNYSQNEGGIGKTINSFTILNSDYIPHSQNLLKNSSFEVAENAFSSSHAKDWSSSNILARISSNDTQYGDYVISTKSTSNSNSYISQTIPVNNTGYYTFSAYTKGLSESISGLKMTISSVNNSNSITKTEYIYITDTNDEWQRKSVTIEVPEGTERIKVEIGFSNSYGTFLIDNLQLENSISASEYNLIENGEFAYGTDDWNTSSNNQVVSSSILGKNVYALQMNSANNVIYKSIEINGKKNDVYNIGGWMKSTFVNSSTHNSLLRETFENQGETPTLNFTNDRYAQIEASYQYTEVDENGIEQTLTDTVAIPFFENVEDWQFVSNYLILKGDCDRITVVVRYLNHINPSFVSGIELSHLYSPGTQEIEETPDVLENSGEVLEPELTTCVCGEACKFGEGCSCSCSSAESCTCSQCHRDFDIQYDNHGNLKSISMTDVALNEILTLLFSRDFSATGNYQISSTDLSNNTSYYSYNESNGMLNSVTDPRGSVTNYIYNEMGLMTKLEKVVSNLTGNNNTTMETEYGYENDRISYIRRNGFTYFLDYNIWGNISNIYISKLNESTNTSIAEYTYYDGADRDLIQKVTYGISGNCGEILYTYNNANQISTINYKISDNSYTTVDFEYNRLGGLIKCIDRQSGRTTNYNDNGSVTINMEDGTTTEYLYDNNDNYVEKIYSKNYTTIEQETDDSSSRKTDVISTQRYSGSSTVTAGISKTNDNFHRPNEKIVMSKSTLDDTSNYSFVKSQYTYKNKDSSLTTNRIDSVTNVIGYGNNVFSSETTAYDYDVNGNITAEYSEVNGVRTLRYRYTYDEAEQLVRFDNNIIGKTYVYKYNKGGNRKSTKEYNYTLSDNLGTARKTTSATYGNIVWEDKLTAYGLKSISYDSIGQVTSYDGWDYTWRNRNLEEVTNEDTRILYDYDTNGLRTLKVVYDLNTSYESESYRYIWNDNKINHVQYTDTRGVYDYDTYYAYIVYDGNEPVGMMISSDTTDSLPIQNEIYLYVKNIQGDIIGIVDNNGNTLVTYSYDAWGNVNYNISQQNSIIAELVRKINPFTYRGYCYDYEIGLYYLQSRYYRPEWGRFISADVYLDTGTGVLGSNVFTYCNNNVLNFVDKQGIAPQKNSTGVEVVTNLTMSLYCYVILENSGYQSFTKLDPFDFAFSTSKDGINVCRLVAKKGTLSYKGIKLLIGTIENWKKFENKTPLTDKEYEDMENNTHDSLSNYYNEYMGVHSEWYESPGTGDVANILKLSGYLSASLAIFIVKSTDDMRYENTYTYEWNRHSSADGMYAITKQKSLSTSSSIKKFINDDKIPKHSEIEKFGGIYE